MRVDHWKGLPQFRWLKPKDAQQMWMNEWMSQHTSWRKCMFNHGSNVGFWGGNVIIWASGVRAISPSPEQIPLFLAQASRIHSQHNLPLFLEAGHHPFTTPSCLSWAKCLSEWNMGSGNMRESKNVEQNPRGSAAVMDGAACLQVPSWFWKHEGLLFGATTTEITYLNVCGSVWGTTGL